MFTTLTDEKTSKKGIVTRTYEVTTRRPGHEHLREYEITAVENPGVGDINRVTIKRGKKTHIEGEVVPRDHVPSVVRNLVRMIESAERIDDELTGHEPKAEHDEPEKKQLAK